MKLSKLLTLGFAQAAGVFIYVALVATVMTKMSARFTAEQFQTWVPIAILLLFTLSAAICGSLVFGRAAYLFLNGMKREGVTLAGVTIGWLFVFTIIVFVALTFST